MRLLAGRYRLVEPVGRGGTAVVWRAVDELLDRVVAIKMLAPQLAHDRRSRTLIRAEAQTAARLNHPHVANVYDYGEAWTGGSRRVPYLVLEFVDGETLASRLGRHGALDWPDAVRICADVAAALAATHAAGLVHRDVKPGNVLLSPTGVKLVDLGIALGVGEESANSRGEVRGTPAYVAPEQLYGGAAVPASDVYALGLVLAECLTGRSLRSRGLGRPEPVHPQVDVPVAPGAPEEISELCQRCLAPTPADRPTSAEVARLLAEVASLPAPARPAVAAVGAAAPQVSATAPTWAIPGTTVVAPHGTRGRRGRRPSRQAVLLAALPVTAVTAAFAVQLPGLTSTKDAAESAGPDAAPAPAAVSSCLARYTSLRAADGTFAAEVAVTVVGASPAGEPVLSFTLPAGQRLTEPGGRDRVEQSGRTVSLPLPGAADARPVTVSIRGTYDATSDGTARDFSVDGVTCDRSSTSVTSVSPSPLPSDRKANESTGGGRPAPVGAVSDDDADRRPGAGDSTERRPSGSDLPGPATPSPSTSPSQDRGSDPAGPESPAPASPSPDPSEPAPTASPDPTSSTEPAPEPTGTTGDSDPTPAP